MKKLLMLLLAGLLASACGQMFVEKQGHFVVDNRTNHAGSIVIDGREAHFIPARQSVSFDSTILVPQRRLDNPNGPSSIDRTVEVGIVFQNATTGAQTHPIFCDAGAKIVTTISNDNDQSGEDRISCHSTYPRNY